MFVELAQSLMSRSDIPTPTIETLVMMILAPMFWILRICAVIGILYPIIKLFFLNTHLKAFYNTLIFGIIWGILNISIVFSRSPIFWKWLWIDIVGLFIFMTLIFVWNNNAMKEYYKAIYLQKKQDI